jgi:hypothetical protein
MDEDLKPEADVEVAKPRVLPITVGRQLWYRPMGYHPNSMCVNSGDQPLACTVLYVWSDRCINADVIDHGGKHHFISSCMVRQPDDEQPQYSHAEWMPYQIKVAT